MSFTKARICSDSSDPLAVLVAGMVQPAAGPLQGNTNGKRGQGGNYLHQVLIDKQGQLGRLQAVCPGRDVPSRP